MSDGKSEAAHLVEVICWKLEEFPVVIDETANDVDRLRSFSSFGCVLWKSVNKITLLIYLAVDYKYSNMSASQIINSRD